MVEFYHAHPGMGGALVPIPTIVKEVADSLNGQTLEFESGYDKIKEVVSKHCPNMNISYRDGCILLMAGSFETHMHCWCVIKYKEVS